MIKDDQQYIFGDCAINPTLEAQDLAELTAFETFSTSSDFAEPLVEKLNIATRGDMPKLCADFALSIAISAKSCASSVGLIAQSPNHHVLQC